MNKSPSMIASIHSNEGRLSPAPINLIRQPSVKKNKPKISISKIVD